MRKRSDDSQLSFDLSAPAVSRDPTPARCLIVPFVDQATLDARRDAVRRVVASGVFALPNNLRPS